MKIALVAPSSVPFVVGGAEKLWWGLTQHINRHTPHELELIKLPSPERNFWEVVESYERFSNLDLRHFDAVLSTKYPAWMVEHPNHVVYLQHTLRGLYDTWPRLLPTVLPRLPGQLAKLGRLLSSDHVSREMLPEIFGSLREWRGHGGEETGLMDFPGALIRAVVHKLDSIALAPGAIKHHAAISQTVRRRAGYFPDGTPVTVVPHPSNLEGLEGPSLGEEFVFTASRLDGPKRIDMIIDAYRHCRTQMPLVIAGDGPMAGSWREKASGDARVRFLGRISDEQMVEHYRKAALVVFVPHDEDMGLITLEAMQAGKPVVTVSDAGGVAEFVQDGVNGRVVPPDVRALGKAINELLESPDKRERMGLAARRSAAEVTWSRTTSCLLGAMTHHASERKTSAHEKEPAAQDRLRLLVLNTFDVWPPDSGGRKRIYHLYRGIAQWADVTLLNLGPVGTEPIERYFEPHFKEVVIPASPEFSRREGRLGFQLKRSVGDIAALMHWPLLKEYVSAFKSLSADADVVIATHCYMGPLIDFNWRGRVWYDAHNVEADMKADILGLQRPMAPARNERYRSRNSAAWEALNSVMAAEGQLVKRSEQVWAVSKADLQRLADLYGPPAGVMQVVPNGTTVPDPVTLEPSHRAERKARLGIPPQTGLALFVGSNHGPNNAAAQHVVRLAGMLPGWRFAFVGSVCETITGTLPPNVMPLGRLSEKELWALLAAADVGLNPMEQGSGTNLKILDYAAHGVLVLSTPVGLRGGVLVAGEHAIALDLEQFVSTLVELEHELPAPREVMRRRAYMTVKTVCSWSSIATGIQRFGESMQTAS